ncbi:hypothetical protein MRX96_049348 [Rhipicephalus microplus]
MGKNRGWRESEPASVVHRLLANTWTAADARARQTTKSPSGHSPDSWALVPSSQAAAGELFKEGLQNTPAVSKAPGRRGTCKPRAIRPAGRVATRRPRESIS